MDVGDNDKQMLKPDVVDATNARDAHADAIDRRRLRRIVSATVLLLLVFAIIRVFVFEPYAIPTGSMRPTILEGDVLLVNKLPFTLERGDVVVFDFPTTSSDERRHGEQFVKRTAALAGDTVQMIGGRIRVNGVEVPRAPNIDARDANVAARRAAIDARRAWALLRYGGAIRVPKRGETIAMDSISAARWASIIRGEGARIEYRNRIVFIDGLPATYYTIRRDYFFALGDN
ncbi:MAG: signal peptidase I, partial [bacterium]|nr:signal peptidase I [Candidatus Kapabacteria bacterium]